MIEVCVDANLVVKWYTPEDLRDESIALLDECDRLNIRIVAPDFIIAEAGSAIRRKLYRGLITADEGRMAISMLSKTRIDYVAVLELLPDAWCIAEKYNLATLLDAYYLALAEGLECDFWTADRRFVNSVRGNQYIKHIADFSPGMLED